MTTLAIENRKAIIIQGNRYQEFLSESEKHKVSNDIITKGRIFNDRLAGKQK